MIQPTLTALVRSPGPELAQCELTHLIRQPIDIERAAAQHREYQAALRAAGLEVIGLPSDSAFPDGVFVEDTAVVLDEVAVLTSPAPQSRRGESAAIGAALSPYRRCLQLPPDALLEGGDVLRVGRTLFVGLSSRTNESGVSALEAAVRPFGYSVASSRVTGCLHLKSAVCALDDETVLINRNWVEEAPFSRFLKLDVPRSEPFAANVLRLPDRILVSSEYDAAQDLIQSRGFRMISLDVSELHKAEAGLTCMSLLFDVEHRAASDGHTELRRIATR